LLRDLFDQHDASRQRSRFSAELRAPGIAIRSEGRQDAPDNPFWLAKQVTEAVSDHTGTLIDPGRYVRAKLFLTWSRVPFLEGSYEVAWLWATEQTETGPIFVALCGSLRNYLAYDPADGRTAGGWFPSSPEGLTYLVRCFAHSKDDPYAAARRPKEVSLDGLFTTAYAICDRLALHHQIGQAEMDVLFEVFEYADDVELEGVPFRRALIGTPLWVATAAPQPFAHRPRYEPVLVRGDSVEDRLIGPPASTRRSVPFGRIAQLPWRRTGR
jgi:hypothetical protein